MRLLIYSYLQEIVIPMYVQLTVKEVGVIGATAAQSVMQEPKLRPILSLKTQ